VVLRWFVGVMLGMSGMTSSSVSMMRGGFVGIILMMLCSFGVMLGRVFAVLGGVLMLVRSLMIRNFSIHFFESLVDLPAEAIGGAVRASRHPSARTVWRTCDDGRPSTSG
jgi:hypothetical protein